METRWAVSIEDIVYTLISAGLMCFIIVWMVSVLIAGNKNYNSDLHTPGPTNSLSASPPQVEIYSHSHPLVPQQYRQALNIHPLKVL